jgi:hypothetical protein
VDYLEQTRLWVEGTSVHNNERDECCPDFSCCRPELLAPLEVRKLFYKVELEGNTKVMDRLLGEFLSNLISVSGSGKKVHIVGLHNLREERD